MGVVRKGRPSLANGGRVIVMDVVVVSSVAVEVRADQKRAHGDTWVSKVTFTLRCFVSIGAGSVSRLTFIYKVLLALMRI